MLARVPSPVLSRPLVLGLENSYPGIIALVATGNLRPALAPPEMERTRRLDRPSVQVYATSLTVGVAF